MSAVGEIAEVQAAGAEASAVASAQAADLVTAAANLETARVAADAEANLEELDEELERELELWRLERNELQTQVAGLVQALQVLPTAEQIAALLSPLQSKLESLESRIVEAEKNLPSRPAEQEVVTAEIVTPPQAESAAPGAHPEAETNQRYRYL